MLHELRKDYLLDKWAIIASGRKNRPQPVPEKHAEKRDETCPFCPGNEEETPPEILRYPVFSKNWRIRVVPNKFKAVDAEGKAESLDLPFRSLKTAIGRHEVIIETPGHGEQFADFSISKIIEVVDVFAERVRALEEISGVKEVTLFKNQGKNAGASLSHSHSQIIALNSVSRNSAEEAGAFEAFFEERGICPYCKIVSLEMDSQRRVHENNSFACFTPFASRAGYQLSIFPKRHSRHFSEMSEGEKRDFASILKKALYSLKGLAPDYNLFFKNALPGKDFHWHVSIMPRLMTRAGFEEATDTIINVFSPEDCAAYYREKFGEVEK